jgi:hypothetical protein
MSLYPHTSIPDNVTVTVSYMLKTHSILTQLTTHEDVIVTQLLRQFIALPSLRKFTQVHLVKFSEFVSLLSELNI